MRVLRRLLVIGGLGIGAVGIAGCLPAPTPPLVVVTPVSCELAYIGSAGICVPKGPPDLNCDQIPYRNFPVGLEDPHWFDEDGDGIGCEA